MLPLNEHRTKDWWLLGTCCCFPLICCEWAIVKKQNERKQTSKCHQHSFICAMFVLVTWELTWSPSMLREDGGRTARNRWSGSAASEGGWHSCFMEDSKFSRACVFLPHITVFFTGSQWSESGMGFPCHCGGKTIGDGPVVYQSKWWSQSSDSEGRAGETGWNCRQKAFNKALSTFQLEYRLPSGDS